MAGKGGRAQAARPFRPFRTGNILQSNVSLVCKLLGSDPRRSESHWSPKPFTLPASLGQLSRNGQ